MGLMQKKKLRITAKVSNNRRDRHTEIYILRYLYFYCKGALKEIYENLFAKQNGFGLVQFKQLGKDK